MKIQYTLLTPATMREGLFEGFNRYQKVEQCWRKENGQWVLKDIPFVEEWSQEEYAELLAHLQNTLRTGGAVWGAFQNGQLAGFASVEHRAFGSKGQYVQLSSLHVSHTLRGKGIGRTLLDYAKQSARKMGAQKLYISAHSSKETQAFYQAAGCVEAKEYDARLTQLEPCDCQLELAL